MNIDEIIELLVEVRVDLTVLKKSVTSKEIKEQLKIFKMYLKTSIF